MPVPGGRSGTALSGRAQGHPRVSQTNPVFVSTTLPQQDLQQILLLEVLECTNLLSFFYVKSLYFPQRD